MHKRKATHTPTHRAAMSSIVKLRCSRITGARSSFHSDASGDAGARAASSSVAARHHCSPLHEEARVQPRALARRRDCSFRLAAVLRAAESAWRGPLFSRLPAEARAPHAGGLVSLAVVRIHKRIEQRRHRQDVNRTIAVTPAEAWRRSGARRETAGAAKIHFTG